MSEIKSKTSNKRILWCNRYCLLDSTSGAAISVREMLKQLQQQGWQVMIVGATHFDTETAAKSWSATFARSEKIVDNVIRVSDSTLTHHLVTTRDWCESAMQLHEIELWLNLFVKVLQDFNPDVVFSYGGKRVDWLMAEEAKQHGAQTAMYLANDNYHGERWHRDIDLLLTNSQAAANRYHKRLKRQVFPLGVFVDPKQFTASQYSRERVLFINPSLTKGAALVAALALHLEKRRPDIQFEIVASRGPWEAILKAVSKQITGQPRHSLENVILTPNTRDMKAVYGRARVLMAPSLWWEALGRVVVEGLFNGIPVIATPRGGLPQAMGTGGIMLDLPSAFYQAPYNHIPDKKLLNTMADKLCRFYDDEAYYQKYVNRALESASYHNIQESTRRLTQALSK